MIKQFEKLTSDETELLLKAPVLVSVLASTADHEVGALEKADAIKLAHFKTFTADPMLIPYYKEVDKNFIQNFEMTVKKYAPFDAVQREKLKKKINIVNTIIAKLNKEYAKTLHMSLSDYAEHVKKAGRGLLENFIFPLPLSGLNN